MKSKKIVNQKDSQYLISQCPVIKEIFLKYGLPPNWQRAEGYESLVQIILEQQVSLASAKAHFIKLKSFVSDITPENILLLSDSEMRACQVSRQKASYLRALSNAVVERSIDLLQLRFNTETQVRQQLTRIKGIGHWTTDIYLISCLGFPDILPIGDIAIVNTIRELTSAKTKEEIVEFAMRWSPRRSLASYFCWHYYLSKRNREFLID